jgi:hypothetical protein
MPYKDPQKMKESARRHYLANPAPYKKRAIDRAKEYPEEGRVRANRHSAKLRSEVVSEYGGKCVCCGENNEIYLSIDHIDGGGAEHRRLIGGSGSHLYNWLKRNNYPKDNFRLLCFNCNHAVGVYGVCPHQGAIDRNTHSQRKHFRLKLRVIAAYDEKCVCCGEIEPVFLTIDHMNGGGKTHRKEVGYGSVFYYWLQRNGFPQDGFQLLCQNCNHVKEYSDCRHGVAV